MIIAQLMIRRGKGFVSLLLISAACPPCSDDHIEAGSGSHHKHRDDHIGAGSGSDRKHRDDHIEAGSDCKH